MIKLLNNKYAHLALVLVIGIFAGLFLKDTKSIEEKSREEVKERYESVLETTKKSHLEIVSKLQEKITTTENSSKEYKEEISKKLTVLKTENHQLKQKVTKRRYKLIKPDGTIIEKEFEESDTDQSSTIVTSIREEFDKKILSIEKRWKKVHIARVKALKKKFDEELKKKETRVIIKEKIVTKEKIVKVNEKKFRPEIGVTSDMKVYIHTSYPIWGPIFIGGGGAVDKSFNDASARIGIGWEF